MAKSKNVLNSIRTLLGMEAEIELIAEAVLEDGTLVHDFLFAESKRSIHVCNAPSPAATSAIPIGKYITEKAAKAYNNLT